MKKLYLILLLSSNLKGFTQVILTVKDSLKIGTNIIFENITDTSIINNFKFTKTGTNNIWDFSKLDLLNFDTVKIIHPNQTIYKDDFEECNLAFGDINGFNGTYYYKTDSVGFYEVGFVDFFSIAPFHQIIKRSHPLPVLLFPSSYPLTIIDTNYMRSKSFIYHSGDSAYCERYTYRKREIVATGIIKLPFGNFESFLLKNIDINIDTTWFKDNTGKIYSQINIMPNQNIYFDWYCNKSTFFVARVKDWFEYPIGVENIGRILVQMNNYANLKSISVDEVKTLKIGIYPNPANDKLYIENNMQQQTNYTITNMLGQQMAKGNLKTEIEIANLPTGVYILKIINKNNQAQVLKFIKQ